MPFGGKKHDDRAAEMRRRYSKGRATVERQQHAALHPHRAEPVDPWASERKEKPVSTESTESECVLAIVRAVPRPLTPSDVVDLFPDERKGAARRALAALIDEGRLAVSLDWHLTLDGPTDSRW
jgi:hypothetical protein